MKQYLAFYLGLGFAFHIPFNYDIFKPFNLPPIKTTNPIDWRNFQQNNSSQQYFHEQTNGRFYPHGGKGSKREDNNYKKPQQKISRETRGQRNSRFEKILTKRRYKLPKTKIIC